MSELQQPVSRVKDHERPLSPHLTVYRWSITMALSITHRATGLALAAGLVLLVAGLWVAAVCPESYPTVTTYVQSLPGRLFLLVWIWAFFYHFLNGIRHLFWDIGQGLELHAAIRSGWIVAVGSLVMTACIGQFLF